MAYAFYSKKEVYIGKYPFIMIQESYNEYGDKGLTLMLYAKGTNKDQPSTLRMVLEHQTGSCTARSAQVGVYEIEGNRFTLYSHWERYNKEENAPIGDRIQVYEVDENGSLAQVSSRVYIEKYEREKCLEEGMKYLYTDLKSAEEKQALEKYKASVEHIFKAKFVLGKEAKQLASEVRQALIAKQKQRWQ